MMSRHGAPSAMASPELRKKISATIQEKYGADWAPSIPGVFDAARQRCQDEHGVDHWTKLDSTKQARAATCLKQYGFSNPVKSPIVLNKRRQNWRNKYGADHPQQIKAITDRRYKTWLKNQGGLVFGSPTWWNKYQPSYQQRTGFAHPTQDPERIRKWMKTFYPSCFRTKEMVLPSGNTIQFQGYEDKAINHLLKSYRENGLLWGDEIPQITYVKPDGEPGLYFPDLCLEHEKILIEVKSTYTLMEEIQRGLLRAKFQGALKAGWNPRVEVWSEREDFPVEIDANLICQDDGFESFSSFILELWPEAKISFYEIEVPDIGAIDYRVLYQFMSGVKKKFKTPHFVVFEDEWKTRPNIVKNFLFSLVKSKRQGSRIVPQFLTHGRLLPEHKIFLQEQHYLGAVKTGGLVISAIWEGKIVGLWVFKKRNSETAEWTRACWDHNFKAWQPHGEALQIAKEKLAQQGIKEMVSFSDNRYHSGKLYEALGFSKTGELPPDYMYTDGHERQHKFRFRVPAGVPEEEFAARKGWYRIQDLGKLRFGLETSSPPSK